MKNFKIIIVASILVFAVRGAWASTATIEGLIHDMRASTDNVQVRVLGQMLRRLEPKNAKEVEILIAVLEDHPIAPYAQGAIANTKDPVLCPALHEGLKVMKASLPRLTKDQSESMSREQQEFGMIQALSLASVIHVLGGMKYAPAAPDLRELLDYSEDFQGYISFAASKALGKMGDEQAYQMMMADLEMRTAVTVSGYGAKAIQAIVSKIDEIHASYEAKPHQDNDPRAVQIGELAAKIGCPAKNDEEAKRLLLSITEHPEYEVRYYAARALVVCMEQTDKALTRTLLSHGDTLVRRQGLEALVMRRTWDKSFLPIVIDMIQNDPDDGVRHAAIALLRRLIVAGLRRSELQEAVPYLKVALQDTTLSIRAGAFNALRAITGRFYPYEGMPRWDRTQMKLEPAYMPEDTSRSFYGTP